MRILFKLRDLAGKIISLFKVGTWFIYPAIGCYSGEGVRRHQFHPSSYFISRLQSWNRGMGAYSGYSYTPRGGLGGLPFFIQWWRSRKASIEAWYVKELGRSNPPHELLKSVRLNVNTTNLITIAIRAKSALHLTDSRIWVKFPENIRVIYDLLQELPQARDSNFPLGDLNKGRYCILDKDKPPTYENLWFPKHPILQRPHVAFYDPSVVSTTLQSNDDYVVSIWIVTPKDPTKGVIEIEVRPANITKKFLYSLQFEVA